MRPSLCFALLVVAVAGTACTSSRTFQDTEGRAFTAHCDWRPFRGTRCSEISSSAPSRPPVTEAMPGDRPGFIFQETMARILGVCDALLHEGGGGTTGGVACRPIVCAQDDDCPPTTFNQAPTCARGLCMDATRPLDSADAVMLCLAGMGPPQGPVVPHTPIADRLDLASAACASGPCVIPPQCRQP